MTNARMERRQVDDIKNGVHQAGRTSDVWRLMITPRIVKETPGRLTISGKPSATVVETRGTWRRTAPRRRTYATIASGPGTWLNTARSRSKTVRVFVMHATEVVPRAMTGSGGKAPTRTRRAPTKNQPMRSAPQQSEHCFACFNAKQPSEHDHSSCQFAIDKKNGK